MPARKLTDEQEAQIAEMYRSRTKTAEIERKFGISKDAALSALRRQHVEIRRPKTAKDNRDEIIRLYTEEGLGVVEIRKLLHHDAARISDVLKEAGIWIRGSRTFTDSEEEQIAKIYLAGYSMRRIARTYGIKNSKTVIQGVLERQGITPRPPEETSRIYSLNPHKFDSIDCEASAYWLGFVLCDGGINRRTLYMSQKYTDAYHLEGLKSFLESESPVKTVPHRIKEKSYDISEINFTHKHLAKRMRELGLSPHKRNWEAAIGSIPGNLAHHFIRGIMDADGSVGKSPPSVGFCSQESMLAWIRKVLAQNCETNPDLKIQQHTKSKKTYYLMYSGGRQSRRIAEFLYRDASVFLKRKREIVDNWKKPQSRTRNELGRFT